MTTPDCIFCVESNTSALVGSYGFVQVRLDGYPVTKLHHLIVPKRHVVDFFGMNTDELKDLAKALHDLRRSILDYDPTVTGFNIGANAGVDAGQTVMHAHVHIIPRRYGDTASPRGGVRGVIPEKMSYDDIRETR